MKKACFTLLTLISSVNLFAQKPDSVLARVRYTYIDKTDTVFFKGKERKENMLLFLSKNTSLYTSYDKIIHEISEEQKFWNMIENGGGKGKSVFIIDDSKSKWMTSTSHQFLINENKFFTREIFAYKSYLLEEIAPVINWKLSKDTMSFSGLNCQKATAIFEGKDWIAWYAPSLPFLSGPWKLNGLPGLIVEAYDANKEIYFQFAGIENAKKGDHSRDRDITKQVGISATTYNTIDQSIGRDVGSAYFENIIRLPIGAVKVTKKQLDKFKETIRKNQKAF